MDTEKHIEKQETEERRPLIDWNIGDVILLTFIVVYVILEPLGAISYFYGRYNPNSILSGACFIFLITGILLPLFSTIWALRPLINWTKYTRRKRFIRIIYICILLFFIVSVFTPINILMYRLNYQPFMYGFRTRIKSNADIGDIRNWLETLKEEDFNGKTIGLYRSSGPLISHWPDSIEWPESLKVFNPHYVNLDLDDNRKPKMSLTWGGPFGHWGVVIGMEDMEIPPSDLKRYGEYRLALEPGVYVWNELQ